MTLDKRRPLAWGAGVAPGGRWLDVKKFLRGKKVYFRDMLQTVNISAFGGMTASQFGKRAGYGSVLQVFKRIFE